MEVMLSVADSTVVRGQGEVDSTGDVGQSSGLHL